MLLVRFGLLSGRLLGNSCPLGWRFVLIVFCLFVVLQIHSIFLSLLFHTYRVTDEALIAETMVWPNFFLMNVFFALKGSKLFIIIYLFPALVLRAGFAFWLLQFLFIAFLLLICEH